jgi:hypothetical protein
MVCAGLLLILLMQYLLFSHASLAQAGQLEQQPTVSIPTVTSTPIGPTVIVNPDQEQINVRAGPGTDYPILGVLVAGQQIPAKGRSPQGLWIQILYFGIPGERAWVYAPLVSAPTGDLPIIEPPATPTPRVTPTIDPTLASQFVVEAVPTRLPTFTAPPPLAIPTFPAENTAADSVGIPMGMVIIGLAVLGVFGSIVSVLRGR